MPCHTLSYYVLPYLALTCLIIPCLILSCHTLPYHALPYLVKSYQWHDIPYSLLYIPWAWHVSPPACLSPCRWSESSWASSRSVYGTCWFLCNSVPALFAPNQDNKWRRLELHYRRRILFAVEPRNRLYRLVVLTGPKCLLASEATLEIWDTFDMWNDDSTCLPFSISPNSTIRFEATMS